MPTEAELAQSLKTLENFPTIKENKLQQADNLYNEALAGYKAQFAKAQRAHNKDVSNNESRLAANRHRALVSAARGQQGLLAVLASLNALGGSGKVLADRAVRNEANADLGGAQSGFKNNAAAITNNFATAQDERDKQREAARKRHQAARQNAKADVYTAKQNVLDQLAKIYNRYDSSAAQSKADNYASKAAALSGKIAKTTSPIKGEYVSAAKYYSPTHLQNYLAGINNLSVGTRAGNASSVPINSPLFAQTDEKRRQKVGVGV